MSFTASFHVLDRSRLPELMQVVKQRPDDAYEALQELGEQVDDDYGFGGYCILVLLEYLAEKGLALDAEALRAERDAFAAAATFPTTIVSAASKFLIPRLDPANFDETEISEFFAKSSLDFEESPMAAAEGLTLIADLLRDLPDDGLLFIDVG